MPSKPAMRAVRPRGGNSTANATPKPTAKSAVMQVNVPAAVGVVTVKRTAPKIASTSNGVMVSNSELVYTGSGTAATLAKTRTSITPRSFAWAAGIAQNYTYYRFKKLHFRYISTSPTSSSGFFDMAITADPEDGITWATGAGYNSLDQFQHFTSAPIWGSGTTSGSAKGGVLLQVDCARLHARVPWYRVDASGVTNAELAQNEAGALLTAALPGVTGAYGRVFVDYEIQFIDPIAVVNNT